MADAARADFLKAKAKEVSLKGKATKKKGKGKAEATAGADEKPKDWVRARHRDLRTAEEGQRGPRRDADPQLEQDQEREGKDKYNNTRKTTNSNLGGKLLPPI